MVGKVMPSWHLIVAMVGNLVVLAFAGCIFEQFVPPGDPTAPENVWTTVKGLPDAASGWWNFTVTMTVNRTIAYVEGGCPTRWHTTLRHEDGEVITLVPYDETEETCAEVEQKEKTKPGTYEWKMPWNSHLGPAEWGSPHSGPPAPAGDYAIQAIRRAIDVEWTANGVFSIG